MFKVSGASHRKYGLGHPHGLRHLAITEALDLTNGNVRAVRHFSRHSSVETLLCYDDNRTDMAGKISRILAARKPCDHPPPGGPEGSGAVLVGLPEVSASC